MIHPSLQVVHKSINDFIHTDFEIETLDNDCRFTEGPVWNQAGFYLFSDIPANCIYKISDQVHKELFLGESGTADRNNIDLNPEQAGSNGLAYEPSGSLLICQHGSHAIARYDGKKLLPLIEAYEGRPLNSPNDLILQRNGTLYFSDPPYGLRDGKSNPQKYQEKAGVYCYKEELLELICDRYQYPNGVCLSPDERILYICSNKPYEQFISMYDTSNNHFIKNFATENSDGIECDRKGNIYLCNKDGIVILNGDGNRIGLIQLPAVPANLCWGGNDMNDLFICARQYVLLIRGLQK